MAAGVRVSQEILQVEYLETGAGVRLSQIMLMVEYEFTRLTIQQLALAGLAVNMETPDLDGSSFLNDGNVFLYVHNSGGSSATVTAQTPAYVEGLEIAEDAVTILAGGYSLIGPFDTTVFNHDDGCVHLELSGSGLTMAAIHM